jgi:hypothetical protein
VPIVADEMTAIGARVVPLYLMMRAAAARVADALLDRSAGSPAGSPDAGGPRNLASGQVVSGRSRPLLLVQKTLALLSS